MSTFSRGVEPNMATSSLIDHVMNTTLNVTMDMSLNITTYVNDVNNTRQQIYMDTTLTTDSTFQDLTTLSHETEYQYVDYIYPGYAFERTVYLYIWEILVIVTSIVNILVVSILLRKKMRNPINIVLAAIAISDSLTGLTTLPTYIMVYQSTEPSVYGEYPTTYGNSSYGIATHGGYTYDYNTDDRQYDDAYEVAYSSAYHYATHDNDSDNIEYDILEYEGYHLSKDLCRWFMATRFFISKSFHSISIYLTLFLGIQRFISVALPFKAKSLTTSKAILVCIVIAVLSPTLHLYHLVDEKATHGMCEYDLDETGCGGGCIELWIMFVLRNFIPCGVLLLFTILFIHELHKGEVSIRRMESNKGQIARRVVENRRIAVIVTSIVIVFLIPEVPYGFYLLYNAIDKTAYNGIHMDLETNRTVHMAYEILLVLSFHANFYIYTLFNRKFRTFLIKLFVQPVRRMMGDKRRVSVSSTGSLKPGSQRMSQGSTERYSLKSNTSTNLLKSSSNTLSKSTVESTAFMNSVSIDINRTSHHDKDECEVMTANV